jgi:hypothetical protein
MALQSCFLPHFPHQFQGRRPASAHHAIAKGLAHLRQLALPDLSSLFGCLFSEEFFFKAPDSKSKRESIYTPTTLFWAFLAQVLNPGMACQELVGKIRAWLITRPINPKRPALGTSAYCEARLALPAPFLQAAFDHLRDNLQQKAGTTWLWCGREVKVLDGTSASMPDTPANQAEWPQPSMQKPGCGFPVAKMLGVFCLSTGAWIGHALSIWNKHDLALWHQVAHWLVKGDVLVGDAGFCAWALMAELQQRGVDTVFRLHQARSKDMRRGKSLGPNDRVQTWDKPRSCPANSPWQEEAMAKMPEQMQVRVVKVVIERKGFRTKELWLATTLIDANIYPVAQLAELYYRRWSIELFFRDLKTTMQMEVLRCKSPEMIKKEILMHAIAYNAIRALILRSAAQQSSQLGRISFKGALDLVRQWLPKAEAYQDRPRKLAQWMDELLEAISKVQNPERAGRREPRAKKRRDKSYQLLTKPRHLFKEIPHRESYKKKIDPPA